MFSFMDVHSHGPGCPRDIRPETSSLGSILVPELRGLVPEPELQSLNAARFRPESIYIYVYWGLDCVARDKLSEIRYGVKRNQCIV